MITNFQCKTIKGVKYGTLRQWVKTGQHPGGEVEGYYTEVLFFIEKETEYLFQEDKNISGRIIEEYPTTSPGGIVGKVKLIDKEKEIFEGLTEEEFLSQGMFRFRDSSMTVKKFIEAINFVNSKNKV